MKLTAYIVIPILITGFIHYYFFLYLTNDINRIIIDNIGPISHLKLKEVNGLFENFSNLLILSHGLLVSFLIAYGILMTFKIAGPIYRIKKYFNEANPENLDKMILRESDMLRDLAEVYNKNLDKFKR